jgi:hypothetical protein
MKSGLIKLINRAIDDELRAHGVRNGHKVELSAGQDFAQRIEIDGALADQRGPLALSTEPQGPPVLRVDVDGTLAEYEGWKGEGHFGEPRHGAREGMEALKKLGYQLIIWTARSNLGAVAHWLKSNHIPFDKVEHKPHAIKYIDDRAIDGSDDWPDIVRQCGHERHLATADVAPGILERAGRWLMDSYDKLLERLRDEPALAPEDVAPVSAVETFLRGNEWLPLKSSNVAAIRYFPDVQQLEIEFKDGSFYGYADISPAEARDFALAPSPGGWCWDHLRRRGTVFGYRKNYWHISSPNTPRKWMETEESRLAHGRIPPSGFTLSTGPFDRTRPMLIQLREALSSPIQLSTVDIDLAAQDVAIPSEEQKRAGNYRKGHVTVQGLPITIETARGQTRSGTGADGKAWSVTMPWHYGYIKRTESEADGDHVDVFLGPDPDSEAVFIVDQHKPSGRFDEHKAMIGFKSSAAAKEAYLAAYSPDWKGCGGIRSLTMEQFKHWLQEGDTGKPVSDKKPFELSTAYNEADHPRNKKGEWIDKDAIQSAYEDTDERRKLLRTLDEPNQKKLWEAMKAHHALQWEEETKAEHEGDEEQNNDEWEDKARELHPTGDDVTDADAADANRQLAEADNPYRFHRIMPDPPTLTEDWESDNEEPEEPDEDSIREEMEPEEPDVPNYPNDAEFLVKNGLPGEIGFGSEPAAGWLMFDQRNPEPELQETLPRFRKAKAEYLAALDAWEKTPEGKQHSAWEKAHEEWEQSDVTEKAVEEATKQWKKEHKAWEKSHAAVEKASDEWDAKHKEKWDENESVFALEHKDKLKDWPGKAEEEKPAELATDAAGHEHKGKGAGGGQFTGPGTGGGNGATPKAKAAKRVTAVEQFRTTAEGIIKRHGPRVAALLKKFTAPATYLKARTDKIRAKMVKRYGARNTAIIFAAGQAITWGISIGAPLATGLPIVVPPGGGLATSLVLAGLIDAYRRMTGTQPAELSTGAEFADLSVEQVQRVAAKLVNHLLQGVHGQLKVKDGGTELATAHAPAGEGITIAGKHFEPGEFIPGKDLAKASPQQKVQLGIKPNYPTDQPTFYTPDPTKPNPQTGLVEHARVGVPAMQSPPPPSEIPRLPNLDAKQRKVESRYAEAYLAHPGRLVSKYLKALIKKRTVGVAPNVFATDDVKMLNRDWKPGDLEDPDTKKAMARYNTAVHQTANAICKRAFLRYLDKVVSKYPEGDPRRSVLATNGGCAAGKGSSLARSADPASPYHGILPASEQVGAVWDAAGEQNATENAWIYQECQKRGIRTVFAYVWADPKDTWDAPDRGVIRRAKRKGRMVDCLAWADSYALGAKNMHAFHEKYKDKPGASFIFLDNRTKGKPQRLDAFPEEALTYDANALYAGAVKSLKAHKRDLDKSLYKGGLGGEKIWGAPKSGGQTEMATGDESSHWITIGGKKEGDKKHKGGFPVEITKEGVIVHSRVKGLQGKKLAETPPAKPPEEAKAATTDAEIGKDEKIGDHYEGLVVKRSLVINKRGKPLSLWRLANASDMRVGGTDWAFNPDDTRGYAADDRIMHRLQVRIDYKRIADEDDIRQAAKSLGKDVDDNDPVAWMSSKKVRHALANKGFVAATFSDIDETGDYEHQTLRFLKEAEQSTNSPTVTPSA